VDSPSALFQHILANPGRLAASVGALATGMAAASAVESALTLARRMRSTRGSPSVSDGALEVKTAVLDSSPTRVARERVVTRLSEASSARRDQYSAYKWSGRASALLTIAQYIFGGVLASSFIQESLTPKWVGGLGVLVLIASLFRQQFHPEINAENARKKASQLQALIREAEDQLSILDAKIAAGQDHSDAMISLLKLLTRRLTEIENPEAVEPAKSA